MTRKPAAHWARASRILGYVLLIAGSIWIHFGLASTAWFQGVWTLLDVLGPINPWAGLAIAFILAPGFFFLWLGNRFEKRRSLPLG